MQPTISVISIFSWVRSMISACPNTVAHFGKISPRKNEVSPTSFSRLSFHMAIQIFIRIPKLQTLLSQPFWQVSRFNFRPTALGTSDINDFTLIFLRALVHFMVAQPTSMRYSQNSFSLKSAVFISLAFSNSQFYRLVSPAPSSWVQFIFVQPHSSKLFSQIVCPKIKVDVLQFAMFSWDWKKVGITVKFNRLSFCLRSIFSLDSSASMLLGSWTCPTFTQWENVRLEMRAVLWFLG